MIGPEQEGGAGRVQRCSQGGLVCNPLACTGPDSETWISSVSVGTGVWLPKGPTHVMLSAALRTDVSLGQPGPTRLTRRAAAIDEPELKSPH